MEEPILHFAPEALLEIKFRALYGEYRTADLNARADLKLDISAIALEAASVATVICNHVLEHVPDDRRALAELGRILKPGGKLIVSVPLIEGWERTYEDPAITDPSLRDLHFGQYDHLRYYGRDFRDRLREVGFVSVEEITAEGKEVVEYGLMRGEKVFICKRD